MNQRYARFVVTITLTLGVANQASAHRNPPACTANGSGASIGFVSAKKCVGGVNDGQPCNFDSHCPDSTCVSLPILHGDEICFQVGIFNTCPNCCDITLLDTQLVLPDGSIVPITVDVGVPFGVNFTCPGDAKGCSQQASNYGTDCSVNTDCPGGTCVARCATASTCTIPNVKGGFVAGYRYVVDHLDERGETGTSCPKIPADGSGEVSAFIRSTGGTVHLSTHVGANLCQAIAAKISHACCDQGTGTQPAAQCTDKATKECLGGEHIGLPCDSDANCPESTCVSGCPSPKIFTEDKNCFEINTCPPPVFLVAPVTSVDFGSIATETTSDRVFTVENGGGGIVTGAASTSPPFSIVGSGTYSLLVGQSQTVTVRYSPTSVGTQFGHVTFTGPTTQTRQVIGSGYATPQPPGSITGTVTVAGTAAGGAGAPIAGAVIRAGGQTAISGADGHYALQPLQPGTFTLQATASGNYFQANYPGIVVTSAQPTPGPVTLQPRPIVTPPVKQIPVLLVSGFSCDAYPWDGDSCGDACDSKCEINTWKTVRNFLSVAEFDLPGQDYVGEVVWDPNEPTPGFTPPHALGGEIINGSERVERNAQRLRNYVANKVWQYKFGTVSESEPEGHFPPEINIVASSMGGLITRRFLDILESEGLVVIDEQNNVFTPKVTKVIMLGVPNGGSYLADLAWNSPLGRIGTAFSCFFSWPLVPNSVKDLRTSYVGPKFSTYKWPVGADLYLHAGTAGASSTCPQLVQGADLLDGILSDSEEIVSDGAVLPSSVRGVYYVHPFVPGNYPYQPFFPDEVHNSFPTVEPQECKESALDHWQLKINSAAVSWIVNTLLSSTPPPVGTGCPQSASATAQAGLIGSRQIELLGGSIDPGQVREVEIPSDAESNLSIMLLWDMAGTAVSLLDPNGTHVTPTQTSVPNILEYEIPAPTLGTWTAVFDVGGVQPDSVDFGVLAYGDARIALTPNADTSFLSLEEAPIAVFLGEENAGDGTFIPALGATATAVIVAPDMTEYMLNLVDDGLHSDGAPNDGMYADVFTATAQPGQYQIQYRADRVDTPSYAHRRVATGSFEVSSNVARISGTPSDEAIDFDEDGFTDYIQLQFLVTVQIEGDYVVSGRLVDVAHDVSLSASTTLTDLPMGTAPVSLLFDCRATGASGTIGPFSLQNFQLFEQGLDELTWVDRYRDTYTTSSVAVVDLPPTIVWDSNPVSLGRTTRSLMFSLEAPATATATAGQSAIRVTMVDLAHPLPANAPASVTRRCSASLDLCIGTGQGNCPAGQTCDLYNYTTFDTRSNGVCVDGSHAGHHCDIDADCRVCVSGSTAVLHRPCTSNADCGGGAGSCPAGGTCSNLTGCTAAGEPVPADASGQGGCARWVGEPKNYNEHQALPFDDYRAARLQCTPFYYDWVGETTAYGPITVVGGEILPSSTYSVEAYAASCKGSEESCTSISAAVEMLTRRYGDIVGTFNPPGTTQQPDGSDVVQLVNKFRNQPGAPGRAISQIQPNLPELNGDVSGSDITRCVDAVRQIEYRFLGPCPCPSQAVCGALACPSGATVCGDSALPGLGRDSTCIKTCSSGGNAGDPCVNNSHCPGGGTCGNPFCRDRCGRCTP